MLNYVEFYLRLSQYHTLIQLLWPKTSHDNKIMKSNSSLTSFFFSHVCDILLHEFVCINNMKHDDQYCIFFWLS